MSIVLRLIRIFIMCTSPVGSMFNHSNGRRIIYHERAEWRLILDPSSIHGWFLWKCNVFYMWIYFCNLYDKLGRKAQKHRHTQTLAHAQQIRGSS